MINSRISVPLIKCTRIRISVLTFHTPSYPPSWFNGFTTKLTDESKDY